jgi:hypothetical protein
MPINKNNEYYLVDGWFEQSKGIHQGTFYGAMSTQDDPLTPRRVTVTGADAKLASELASSQPAKVFPEEILESVSDAGGLNPREREDTQNMLLDDPEWMPGVRDWAVQCKGDAQVFFNGRQLFISFGDWVDDIEGKLGQLRGLAPDVDMDWDYETGVPSEDFHTVTEMVSSGGISMAPAPILPIHMDKSRNGMPDRGGHGHIDNLGPKKVKTGKNTKGSGRNRLKGFGDRASVLTINQAGGRRGGKA